MEKSEDGMGRKLPLDYDFDGWEKTRVPSCFNLHKREYFWYEGPAVYTRKFKYIPEGEKRVILRIGAVNYEAKVFLNKKYIGFHRGGSTPFYFDVTGILQEENRLLVVADNTRVASGVPMQNTDWFNYGGIYRDVELLRLPSTFIRNFFIYLLPGSNYKKIRAEAEISDNTAFGNVRLTIKEMGVNAEIPVKGGIGGITFDAEPELWSPENPKLYNVEADFEGDILQERIGFREIRIYGTDILINGQKIFLRGICCHEDSAMNGKALTEQEIRENIMIAKDLGCNYIRLAHYPHSEKTSEIADELGIMLWEEIPVYWAIDFSNRDTYLNAENQLLEMIKRDFNRASIIIWSIGNENPDTDSRYRFIKALAERAKEMDQSRPVSAACLVDHTNNRIHDRLAEHLDIIGINEYLGWYDPDIEKLSALFENSRPVKPVIICEFGADARAGKRGKPEELFTEDKQLAVYQKQIETIKKIPYIKGMSPWILFDFRCPRRTNIDQRFYNLKGLVTQDKKHKKIAYRCLKKFYQGLKTSIR